MAKRKTIELPNDSFWTPEDYLKNPDLIIASNRFIKDWAEQMMAKCTKQGSGFKRFIRIFIGTTRRRIKKIRTFLSRWEKVKSTLSRMTQLNPRLEMLQQMVNNVKKADPNCRPSAEATINGISDNFSSETLDLNLDMLELIMDMEDFQTNL